MRYGFAGLAMWVGFGVVQAQAPAPESSLRYISDETAITLRQDKGVTAPVAGLLKSGARVELLETDAATGYARVKVAPGREGWVLARYLSTEPAARDRLAAMQSQLAEQQARVRKLEADNLRLRDQRAQPVAPAVAEPAPVAAPEVAAPRNDAVVLLTGAGLFVVGLLAGLILPALIPLQGRSNRRREWSPEL